jgi:hypothetical protein
MQDPVTILKDLETPEGRHPLYQEAINQGIYA